MFASLIFFILNRGVESIIHEKYIKQRKGWLSMNKVEIKPREWRNLKPLPCGGVYQPDTTAFFLGPDRMVCQERVDGKCIARGLVPVPVPDGIDNALTAAINNNDPKNSIYRTWSGQLITDRNGGLYDSLKETFLWASQPQARRAIYESLRMKGSCISPYHGIVDAIDKFADLQVRGLLVELADAPTKYTITLGAAVLISKGPVAANWELTYKRPQAIKKVRGSDEAQLVKCTMDELVGLAFATDLPILISSKLYESTGVDGLLAQDPATYKIGLSAPYFNTKQEARLWRAEQARREEEAWKRSQRPAKQVPTAAEISDASTFLRMRTSQKRAILRATGLRELPRPREGPRAVDALIIPLLDEEVAYEVLRRLAETRGDFAMAAEMSDFESRKPALARLVNQARAEGDYERAKELCDELNSLSTLKFDPTNPDGKPGEWDVEEWYWEQRKRVYGIIAA